MASLAATWGGRTNGPSETTTDAAGPRRTGESCGSRFTAFLLLLMSGRLGSDVDGSRARAVERYVERRLGWWTAKRRVDRRLLPNDWVSGWPGEALVEGPETWLSVGGGEGGALDSEEDQEEVGGGGAAR